MTPPKVFVRPLTVTVFRKEAVVLNCRVIGGGGGVETIGTAVITWYRDNISIPENDTTAVVTHGGMTSQLNISSAEKSEHFDCIAKNVAGPSTRVGCKVTVVDRGFSKLCEEERTDGLSWTQTVAGMTARQPCPRGFIGEASRSCVETPEGRGTWQPPNMMGCVTKAFVDVKEMLEQMDDGIGANDRDVAAKMLESATNVTEELPPGDINVAINLMRAVISVEKADVNTSVAIVRTVNNLLMSRNADSWARVQKVKPQKGVVIMRVVEKAGLLFAAQVTPGSNDSLELDNLGTRCFVTVHFSLVSSIDVIICMLCYIHVNIVSTKRS
ncbi:hypothetical protein NP493_725g01002 [Ridgeia piscesae]|uniref:Ig-like domain-containing protein n=1 Tax=Ridgeia piscesae TaxID=27915 RepID=A0AAD9KQ26_RIDPI|nr:hypothetical protein NP493_725g01002 [Ridgeia piscesae]